MSALDALTGSLGHLDRRGWSRFYNIPDLSVVVAACATATTLGGDLNSNGVQLKILDQHRISAGELWVSFRLLNESRGKVITIAGPEDNSGFVVDYPNISFEQRDEDQMWHEINLNELAGDFIFTKRKRIAFGSSLTGKTGPVSFVDHVNGTLRLVIHAESPRKKSLPRHSIYCDQTDRSLKRSSRCISL